MYGTADRSGKDDVALNLAATQAFEHVGEYWHMLPEAAQSRKAIWEAVDPHTGKRRIDQAFPMELRETTRETDMMIRFINGSIWRVVGSDNYDSLVGSTPRGIVFSEYALAKPAAWDYLRPIVAANGGWAVFISTPRGDNHLKQLYDYGLTTDGWFSQRLTVDDTDVFRPEQLGNELAEMQDRHGPEDGRALFDQEYRCSFVAPLIGSYYARLIEQAEKSGRVGDVPVDPRYPVHSAWDLGVADSTAIFCFQVTPTGIRVVDYFEATGQGIEFYAEWLDSKGYHGKDLLPHDARQRMPIGNPPRTRIEIMLEIGRKPQLVPLHHVPDGISAVRKTIPLCAFDTKAAQGVRALRNYRRQWNDDRKIFSDAPLHDWACFTGDTEVLTRYGRRQIMHLENEEVLTPCGWKRFKRLGVTGRNAPLVEVEFADGHTVRCTPEHMFLTEHGWKSAESLTNTSQIQSSLTPSRSISMAVSIVSGRAINISREAARNFIAMFGRWRLGLSPAIATSITKMGLNRTTAWGISSVCLPLSISALLGKNTRRDAQTTLLKALGKRPLIGTNLKRGAYGTDATRCAQRVGRSGSAKTENVSSARRLLTLLFEKVATRNCSAPQFAKPLRITRVEKLTERADVWCIEVPDGAWFTLANGAVVHNSHGSDAFRTLAMGWVTIETPKPKEPETINTAFPTIGEMFNETQPERRI